MRHIWGKQLLKHAVIAAVEFLTNPLNIKKFVQIQMDGPLVEYQSIPE